MTFVKIKQLICESKLIHFMGPKPDTLNTSGDYTEVLLMSRWVGCLYDPRIPSSMTYQ